MDDIYELVRKYIISKLSNTKDRFLKIHYTDLVKDLPIKPSTAIMYLRAICRELGGEYVRGVCLIPSKQTTEGG
jgi:hypothetical protein